MKTRCSRYSLLVGATAAFVISGCVGSSPPVHTVNRVVMEDSNSAANRERVVAAISPAGVKDLIQLTAKSPDQVRAGESFVYSIQIANTSDNQSAHDVRVSQDLAKGHTIESSEPERQDTDNKSLATWQFDTLRPGETKSIAITASSDQEGDLHQCLTLSYLPAFCFTTKIVKPEIQVAKMMPPKSSICDPISVHYTITNGGTAAAKNIVIIDELPEGLVTQDGKRQVTFEAEALEPGKARVFELQLIASQAGELGSRATAKIASGQEARSNYASTAFFAPDLQVAIDGPDIEYVRRPMTYVVTLINNGKAPAYSTRLAVDTATARMIGTGRVIRQQGDQNASQQTTSAQSSSKGSGAQSATATGASTASQSEDRVAAAVVTADREVVFDLGNVGPGETVEVHFTLVANVRSDMAVRAVATMACPAKTTDERVAATTQTQIVAFAALLVATVDKLDPVQLGNEIDYTVLVQNQGDAPDKNVRITAKLPEHMEYVSSGGVTEAKVNGRELTFAPLSELRPGDQVNWYVKAKAIEEGDARFKVELTSESQEEPIATEEPTRIFSLKSDGRQQDDSQKTTRDPSNAGKAEKANAKSSKSESAQTSGSKSVNP